MPIDISSVARQSFSPIWLWGCFALLLIIITQLLNFNGLYGQDGHEYLRYSLYLKDVFAGAEGDSNFFYPIAYPLFGTLLGYVFTNTFALQLISMISLVISAYCLYGILNIIFPSDRKEKVLFVSLIFVLSPFMLRASIIVMSDLFALMWVLLALWQFLRYWDKPEMKYMIGFAFATGFATITRYATAMVLLLPFLFLLYKITYYKKYAHLPLLVLFLLLGPGLQIYIKGVDVYGLFDHPLILEWEFENMFKSQFDAHEGFLEYPFINLLYPFSVLLHPGFFVLFLPLLFFLKRSDISKTKCLFLAGIFGLYSLFLAGIPFQNDRFLLLAFPLLLPLFYPSFNRSVKWVKSKAPWSGRGVIALIVLLQLALAVWAVYPFWKMNQMERKIAQTVKQLESDKKLYTFGWDIALRSYDVNMQMVNLRNEDVNEAQPGDYVLFNEDKLKTQWEGRSVMNHYRSLKNSFQLIERKEFGENWTLYELN